LEKRIKEKFISVYNRLVKQREDSRKASKAPPPGHIEPRPANLVQAESSALPVSSSSMSAPPLHSTRTWRRRWRTPRAYSTNL